MQQVSDIEENIWAPKFGLKGMIDASLHIGLGPEVSPLSLFSAFLPEHISLKGGCVFRCKGLDLECGVQALMQI